jgi:hypothetical protein
MVPHLTSGGDKLSTHHELPCLEKDGEGKQILIHNNRPIVEKSMSKEHQFIEMLYVTRSFLQPPKTPKYILLLKNT